MLSTIEQNFGTGCTLSVQTSTDIVMRNYAACRYGEGKRDGERKDVYFEMLSQLKKALKSAITMKCIFEDNIKGCQKVTG